jgi:phosphoserine aminotransferase
MPTTIEIPADLRPSDGRFGSGPSKVDQAAVERLAQVAPRLLGTSHRRPAVKDLVRRVREGLAAYFALPDGYEVVLGLGGATLFWDAAGHGLVAARSSHAVFGEFSGKFAQAVAAMPWLAEPVVTEAAYGEHPTLAADPSVDAYALTHCETSTGVAMTPTRPGDGLVLVDATSAAGGLRFDPRATDAYYFSPQKAFASDGGLWIALLSPAALTRLDEVAATGRYVPTMLDLRVAVDNSRKDQTYNTPAVATLYLMAEQIDALRARGGLEAVAAECDDKAAVLYGWAEARPWARPFVAEPAKRSSVVCTIDVDDAVPADALTSVLRANGILDVEAYRKLGRNQLRVATFPAVARADVEALTASVDYVVERLSA